MGLPLELKTSRPRLLSLWQTPVVGYLVVLFASLFLFAPLVFPLLPIASAVLHRTFNSDHGLALTLLLVAPVHFAASFFDVKVKIFFVPAWVFCLVLGCFGLAKAQGLID